MADVAGAVSGARVRVTAGDWQEAVRAACAPLIEAGAAEPRYADRCIEMVLEHGPYIVLAPGLALAHARPEDGVVRLGLAVATLAAPVAFGHSDNDPVDVVLAFGSPDAEQHVGLLSALAQALSDGLDAQLRAARDPGTAERLLAGVGRDAG